jgi:hypothetical protein
MAIATGTALALAAGASAGSSLLGAHKQSSAAKKAAEQQAQATAQAQNYYRQGLGQLGQMYAPYINSGMSTMNTLGRLTTPGPGARFASPGPPNAMPQVPQQPPGGYAAPRGGAPPGYAGPYMMADGGDFMVNQPTMFVAGEAGPERATFSGGQQPRPFGPPPGMMPQGMPPGMMPPQGMPQGMMPPQGMPQGMPPDLSRMPPGMRMPQGMSRGMPGRAGALAGAMQGQQAAAPMNAMRGPFARMF